MHHPQPNTDGKGVIMSDLQIIHHTGTRYHLPACDDPGAAISFDDMHAHVQVFDRH